MGQTATTSQPTLTGEKQEDGGKKKRMRLLFSPDHVEELMCKVQTQQLSELELKESTLELEKCLSQLEYAQLCSESIELFTMEQWEMQWKTNLLKHYANNEGAVQHFVDQVSDCVLFTGLDAKQIDLGDGKISKWVSFETSEGYDEDEDKTQKILVCKNDETGQWELISRDRLDMDAHKVLYFVPDALPLQHEVITQDMLFDTINDRLGKAFRAKDSNAAVENDLKMVLSSNMVWQIILSMSNFDEAFAKVTPAN
jgi:hypothetical protein